MPIKAQFSNGKEEITVKSLHQWDYGQQIEIEGDDIPESIIEVHFSCDGMSEAVIRSCTIVGGKGTVPIPDRCLEQSRPITAWVYEIERIDGVVTKCTTTKTITIPVIARTRPSRGEDIPPTIVDSCTELIAEVNEVIDKLNTGEVIANHAKTANTAGYATSAGTANRADTATLATSATRATNATDADHAKVADSATKTTNDAEGQPIHEKYGRINYGYQKDSEECRFDPGVILTYRAYPSDDKYTYNIGDVIPSGSWCIDETSHMGYATAYTGHAYERPVNSDAYVLGLVIENLENQHYKAYLIQVSGF